MHKLVRTLITTVIAAAFLGYAGDADAAKPRAKPKAKPSSYAPGPSNQRVYGAPIQGPIVATASSRTQRARSDFQRLKPCPTTGRTQGACPGYTIGYIKPLRQGGANTAGNMRWQATQVAKVKAGKD